MNTPEPFDFDAYNKQVEEEIRQGTTELLCPMVDVFYWYIELDDEVQRFIAQTAKSYLGLDTLYKGLLDEEDDDRFQIWLLSTSEEPLTTTLSRVFLLRGMMDFAVFDGQSTRQDWDGIEELKSRWRAEDEAAGRSEPAAGSFGAGWPKNAAAWIAAAESWRRLCNSQLSDESLGCWWTLAGTCTNHPL